MASADEMLWRLRYSYVPESKVADSVPVLRHPLLPKNVYLTKDLTELAQEAPKYDFVDPLGSFQVSLRQWHILITSVVRSCLGATIEEDLGANLSRIDLDAVEDISPKKDQILDNTLEIKNKDGPVRGTEHP